MNPNTVPPAARDVAWIKHALQTAIELEYSTLPLYLSAMFSLEIQNYTAYNAIRSIAMEEMVHMAIAANLLAALGGSPQFKPIQIAYPTTGLPGGAEPDLHVGLARYSKPQLKNFLRIETPGFLLRQLGRDEGYPTIAAFYESIRSAIARNANAVRAAVQAGGPANQVGDDIGFTTVTYKPGVDPVESFDAGIDEILQQGEGSGRGDVFAGNPFEDEESHYARFAELYYGARYQAPSPPVDFNPKNEPLFFGGPAIAAPVVVNTLAVPRDGYARILALDPERDTVENDLNAFDSGFRRSCRRSMRYGTARRPPRGRRSARPCAAWSTCACCRASTSCATRCRPPPSRNSPSCIRTRSASCAPIPICRSLCSTARDSST